MKNKDIIVTTIAIIIAFLLGWKCHHPDVETRISTQIDTTYITIHDTIVKPVAVNLVRKDTILLASVDTLCSIDSVFVEVPISEQRWQGQYYDITTEGYRVRLKDVQLSVPVVEKTITKTRTKHWNVGVGVQGGYGITIHGLSPYAGVGVTAGYSF